jgi:AbrB family looped-hinge helix DNA binding protein
MQSFNSETGRIGKRGNFTIPSAFRKRFGLIDGSLVIAEEHEDGILIRPAIATPVEVYSDDAIAGFLLANAVDEDDYDTALTEAQKLTGKADILKPFDPA